MKPARLSRREREIMDALYAVGAPAAAEDVRARLTNPPSSSAVRTMLTRLEEKGQVRHREEGLRYVYEPTTPRAAARRAALNQLVRVFFGGSRGETVTALLKQEPWTDEELDTLERAIGTVRKERKRS
jgi:BlaI family transcriptional regulator, penicillinase repressor